MPKAVDQFENTNEPVAEAEQKPKFAKSLTDKIKSVKEQAQPS